MLPAKGMSVVSFGFQISGVLRFRHQRPSKLFAIPSVAGSTRRYRLNLRKFPDGLLPTGSVSESGDASVLIVPWLTYVPLERGSTRAIMTASCGSGTRSRLCVLISTRSLQARQRNTGCHTRKVERLDVGLERSEEHTSELQS